MLLLSLFQFRDFWIRFSFTWRRWEHLETVMQKTRFRHDVSIHHLTFVNIAHSSWSSSVFLQLRAHDFQVSSPVRYLKFRIMDVYL